MRKIELCFIFAGAALLVACATQAPAPTQTQAQTAGEKFSIPIGYRKTKVNGMDKYCRTDVDTGSRLSRTTVCYTMAQLQEQAADSQNNIQNQMQNANGLGTAVGAGAPSAGR
jgi:hypothetical protein